MKSNISVQLLLESHTIVKQNMQDIFPRKYYKGHDKVTTELLLPINKFR